MEKIALRTGYLGESLVENKTSKELLKYGMNFQTEKSYTNFLVLMKLITFHFTGLIAF